MSPRINNGEDQGIPVINEFFIPDIKKVELEPWDRMAGLGVYQNLFGTGNPTMPISMKSLLLKSNGTSLR
jgi:hypothetical protein